MTEEQTKVLVGKLWNITNSRPAMGSANHYQLIANAEAAGERMRAHCQDPKNLPGA